MRQFLNLAAQLDSRKGLVCLIAAGLRDKSRPLCPRQTDRLVSKTAGWDRGLYSSIRLTLTMRVPLRHCALHRILPAYSLSSALTAISWLILFAALRPFLLHVSLLTLTRVTVSTRHLYSPHFQCSSSGCQRRPCQHPGMPSLPPRQSIRDILHVAREAQIGHSGAAARIVKHRR